MTFLLKQLNQNKDRVDLEKVTLEKLMKSFYEVGDQFNPVLESQLKGIEDKDKESQKIIQQEQEEAQNLNLAEKSPKEEKEEKDEDSIASSSTKTSVDTYKIESITTMIDYDFDNIIQKNYCVYTNYEDFSFAETRNKELLEENFKKFVQANFSGDFQIQSWFNQSVLPKILFLQQKSKFIYTYKILHFNTECLMIQNPFVIPDKGRHIVTPEGHLYFMGGYLPVLKLFSKNTFVLNKLFEITYHSRFLCQIYQSFYFNLKKNKILVFDEHRSLLVPLQNMSAGKADQAVLYFKGNIYSFGGMAQVGDQVQSIKTCEVYNIAEDKWTELPPFEHERQSFLSSIQFKTDINLLVLFLLVKSFNMCTFNDKYIFIFGGKKLRAGATMQSPQPFDFVNEVEVYDLDRSNWRVINYISEKNKLNIMCQHSLFKVSIKLISFIQEPSKLVARKQ